MYSSEVAFEFGKRTRNVAMELIKAISETLGLESDHIAKAMNWDNGLQILAANFYPACPEPDRAIGIPPHTDHGLVTLLIQNDTDGLQVQHKGKWVNWNAMPNAFVVNLGDQMQVLSRRTSIIFQRKNYANFNSRAFIKCHGYIFSLQNHDKNISCF